MLVSIITSLTVTSSAYATCYVIDNPCKNWTSSISCTLPVTSKEVPCASNGVSEPVAVMVALSALGLFVVARRRQSA